MLKLFLAQQYIDPAAAMRTDDNIRRSCFLSSSLCVFYCNLDVLLPAANAAAHFVTIFSAAKALHAGSRARFGATLKWAPTGSAAHGAGEASRRGEGSGGAGQAKSDDGTVHC